MSASTSVLIPDPVSCNSSDNCAAVSDWMEEDFDILAETLLDIPSKEMIRKDASGNLSAACEEEWPLIKTSEESPLMMTDDLVFAPSSPRSIGVVSDADSSVTSGDGALVATKKQKLSSTTTIPSAVATASVSSSRLEDASFVHKKTLIAEVPSLPMMPTSLPRTVTTYMDKTTLAPIAPKSSTIRRKKQNSTPELAKFLRAVAISTQEEQAQKSSSTDSKDASSMSAEELLAYRRERNRELAKQTRERKKNQLTSLKMQFESLMKENTKLQTIVYQHVQEPKAKNETLIKAQHALLKVPSNVWEVASGVDLPPIVADQRSMQSKKSTASTSASDEAVKATPVMTIRASSRATKEESRVVSHESTKATSIVRNDDRVDSSSLTVVEEEVLSMAVAIAHEAAAVTLISEPVTEDSFQQIAEEDRHTPLLPLSGDIPNPLATTS